MARFNRRDLRRIAEGKTPARETRYAEDNAKEKEAREKESALRRIESERANVEMRIPQKKMRIDF